jgi:ribosomal protein L1
MSDTLLRSIIEQANSRDSIDADISLKLSSKVQQTISGCTILNFEHERVNSKHFCLFCTDEQKSSLTVPQCITLTVSHEDVKSFISTKQYKNIGLAIATEEVWSNMSKVVGKYLSPRHIMPSTKLNNVVKADQLSDEYALTLRDKGIFWYADKGLTVKCTIGRTSMNENHLIKNLKKLLDDIQNKLTGIGSIKTVKISSTRSKGSCKIDYKSLND